MMHLFDMKQATLITLVVIFFMLSSGQFLHSAFTSIRKSAKPRFVTVSYEALIGIHLALACATASSALQGHGGIFLRFRPYALPIEPILWINAAIAFFGIALCLWKRKPVMLFEVAICALCTPPAIEAIGAACRYLLIADASFFTFRTCSALALDLRYRSNSISKLSIVDAINFLPEGIVWANKHRDVLFMNDAMRSCLVKLGFATDLSNTKTLWSDLCEIPNARLSQKGEDGSGEEEIRIRIGEGATRLFKHDEVVLRNTPCRRMVAIDISDEEMLDEQIRKSSMLIEASNAEMMKHISDVQAAATHDAIVRMKTRVHDTIGARLSIMHRLLEPEEPTPYALHEAAHVASGILDELSVERHPGYETELASLARSFSVVGVNLNISGSLPKNSRVAEAFVSIAREATTNAAKHGRAKNVNVFMSERSMRIENDGAPPESIHEGTGLPGMRKTAAAIGASFEITSMKPFSLGVFLPHHGKDDQ